MVEIRVIWNPFKNKKTDDIEILTNVNIPEPIPLETGEVSNEYEGMLITISGTITERKGSSLWIDDGSGETRIYIKKEANISLPKIQKNETRASVSGCVVHCSLPYDF